ncbi:MAG: helix-turn-helix transcriptional regulator [Sandaracinaceae bacterium]|nr:helix-turn-helix transcriptional regulator [Sandaracinaceae bacterium]
MHVGASLKLLRMDAGLSLRDLARRIGVSSAYLSRVEHGIDPPPTAERLAAIARELDLPPALLVDAASRVSPFLNHYLETVPGASALFLEIARRRLNGHQLLRVHELIAQEFPLPEPARRAPPPGLAPLLSEERVVPRLRCAELGDALDLAAARLAPALETSATQLAVELHAAEQRASSHVGAGVAVARLHRASGPAVAALLTLSPPLAMGGGAALRVVVVLVSERSPSALALLAHVSRLAAHGLADAIATLDDPAWIVGRITELEMLR